jgi:hypothetical protein
MQRGEIWAYNPVTTPSLKSRMTEQVGIATTDEMEQVEIARFTTTSQAGWTASCGAQLRRELRRTGDDH